MNLLEFYNKARLLDYNSFAEFVSCEIDSEVEIKPKKNKKTIEQRKEALNLKLNDLNSDLPYALISEFFEYWTEHGENDSKMRFEKEKSFSLSLRLKRWARNSKQFKPNTNHIQNLNKM